MAKRYKLSFEAVSEGHLLGVSCHIKDYRLAFFINQTLGTNLKKINNLILSSSQEGESREYPLFYEPVTRFGCQMVMVTNPPAPARLMTFLKNTDFMFLLFYLQEPPRLQEIIREIKSTPHVLMVFPIPHDPGGKTLWLLHEVENHIQALQKNPKLQR